MSFIDAQIEELRRKCTFCLAGRGFDSDQGRATRVTWDRLPYLTYWRLYGSPSLLHWIKTDGSLVWL